MVIWIKRASPFVLIALAWFVWQSYTTEQTRKFEEQQQKYALVTAQVWVASATYRNNPDSFLSYRDSLLNANSLTTDSLDRFLEDYSSEPETLTPFARMVKAAVDSLVAIEDSIPDPADQTAVDTAASAGTVSSP